MKLIMSIRETFYKIKSRHRVKRPDQEQVKLEAKVSKAVRFPDPQWG